MSAPTTDGPKPIPRVPDEGIEGISVERVKEIQQRQTLDALHRIDPADYRQWVRLFAEHRTGWLELIDAELADLDVQRAGLTLWRNVVEAMADEASAALRAVPTLPSAGEEQE
jgi:hypothetical protein